MLWLVAEAGRAAAVRFVFDFEANECSWEFSRKKRPSYPYRNESALASMHTPSREIFDFLMEKRKTHCINRGFGSKEYTEFLAHCVRDDWIEMAAHYIDLGASVEGPAPSINVRGEPDRMLVYASKKGHQDIVKLLLTRGGNTSAPALEVAAHNGHLDIVRLLLAHGADFGDAISKAAAKGYGDIVEELLNNGAEIQNGPRPLLVHAIEHKHEAMFRLLVERGVDLRDHDPIKDCVSVAKEKGLDSMLKLLTEFGGELS